MAELFQDPKAQAVLLFAAVLALAIVIFFVVERWRGDSGEEQPSASDQLSKFREMHSEGVLSDEEYRTIKAKLSEQLRQELKDSDETG